MDINKRREKILEMLNEKGQVTVSELSDIFNISSITIRSDLASLEEKGLLFRVHGGAMNSYKSYCDMDLKQRLGTNLKAKQLSSENVKFGMVSACSKERSSRLSITQHGEI